MKGTNFASLIRKYTRTDSTTLTDAEIVLIANTVKDDFAEEIIKVDEDYFGVPETTNLRATNGSDIGLREYAKPVDNMKINRVEAKVDGSNWLKFERFDPERFDRPLIESEVLNSFGNIQGKAFWDTFRNSIWLYCGEISLVTAGLKIWNIVYPADITASNLADADADLSEDPTDTTSSLPRQFHELWARKVSMIWKSTREKPISYNELEEKFDDDFAKKLASIANIDEGGDYGTLPNDERLQY